MRPCTAAEFISDNSPIIDVRSPSEFVKGHIVGAQSLPLFSDEERAIVGTLYKQDSREAAIKEGLSIVGPKMRSIVERAEALSGDRLRLYCWRGGMRSQSVAWLLESYGIDTLVLEGGYKAYRAAQRDSFERPLKLKVLSGYTGSKKTEVLLEMRELGAQVIDLEGLASHQGSRFGGMGGGTQPSTEHFHNLIHHELRGFDIEQEIWIEDESRMIGHCKVPEGLFKQMEASPRLHIEIPKAERKTHLVSGYGESKTESLIAATNAIRKRLGHERCDQAIAAIQEGDLAGAVDKILHYYDRMYQYALDRVPEAKLHKAEFDHADVQIMAKHILDEH